MRSTLATSCLLLLSVGCGGPDVEPVDTSAPTDLDPTGDTDTAVDTATAVDTDTDIAYPGTPPYTFAGAVTVRSTVDGATVCDLDAALTGRPYTGPCPDCEFTFANRIDDTITRDDSAGDCSYYPRLSFIESWSYFDLILAATPTFYDVSPYARYDDALLSGWAYRWVHGDYYIVEDMGPYFSPVAYDGAPWATFTHEGNDVSWSYTYEGVYQTWEPNHYKDCGTVLWSDTTEGFGAPGSGVTTTLDCTANVIDVWTFEADGGPVTVTVDTVSDATAFDPTLEVNDPDGCTVRKASNEFDCTYPTRFECPSVALDITDTGTYTVVIGQYWSCSGPSSEYELRVEGGTDLVLVEDEADHNILVDHLLRIDIHGTGTLTPL